MPRKSHSIDKPIKANEFVRAKSAVKGEPDFVTYKISPQYGTYGTLTEENAKRIEKLWNKYLGVKTEDI